MEKRAKAPFDPKIFLAKVGEGKTISEYRKHQVVFSQGDAGDAVFYIQKGEIKLTVFRAGQGSRPRIPGITFSAKTVSMAIRCE